jgi:endonuclease-8
MPEGDTIFRAAQALHRALAGEVVVRFATPLPHVARVDEDHPIAGRTVESVAAAGKHLLMSFSGELVLRTHMRMNGSWHLYRPGETWRRSRSAMRVVVETARWVAVGFDVPVVELTERRELARQRELARLGPDLLAPSFDAVEAERRLRGRPEREIGDAVLDQAVLAGIGNVFKSEILFIAGVDPFRTVATLTGEEIGRILRAARELLVANAGVHGGGVPSFRGRRTTGRMNPAQRLWVYGRGGDPCRRCGTRVRFARQGIHARVTYTCPRCQPPSGAAPEAD